MPAVFTKNLIWILLAFAVVIDSLFDIVAFRQSTVTDHTRASVAHRYEVVREIDHTMLAAREAQLQFTKVGSSDLTPEVEALVGELARLQEMLSDEPASVVKVASLVGQLRQVPLPEGQPGLLANETALLNALRQIRDEEGRRLLTELHEDEAQNKIARNEILLASAADILLLVLIAAIWILSYRKRLRIESALNQSVLSLTQANRDLDNLNRAKTNLLKLTAHDLKNPLGSIIGYAELIAEESNKQTVVNMSEIIQKVSAQILDLINSLLQPQTLTQGALAEEATRLNVAECLNEVCDSLRSMMHKKNQALRIRFADPAVEVFGSPQKIRDLFMNLIGNAIKFSPLGSEILVATEMDQDSVQVIIEDQGPGFTSEDKEHLFQPGRALSAKPTGGELSTGIGLLSAKAVIDLHHGQIHILDRLAGPGARVVIGLPCSHP